MKKLEFAKVQEGENKLAIEVSNDSPVVAAVTVDTDQYGDDVTPIVVDSDCVKVKMVGVGSAQAYAVLSTPNICMKSQIVEV